MRIVQAAPIAIFLLGLTGHAGAQLVDCRGGQKPSQVAELMFGRKIGDRIGVSEGEWGRFVDREITPRFPAGLTVFNAAGQWRDKDSNKIVREPSKIVQIVLPGDDGTIGEHRRGTSGSSHGSTRLPRPTRPSSSNNPSA